MAKLSQYDQWLLNNIRENSNYIFGKNLIEYLEPWLIKKRKINFDDDSKKSDQIFKDMLIAYGKACAFAEKEKIKSFVCQTIDEFSKGSVEIVPDDDDDGVDKQINNGIKEGLENARAG